MKNKIKEKVIQVIVNPTSAQIMILTNKGNVFFQARKDDGVFCGWERLILPASLE